MVGASTVSTMSLTPTGTTAHRPRAVMGDRGGEELLAVEVGEGRDLGLALLDPIETRS